MITGLQIFRIKKTDNLDFVATSKKSQTVSLAFENT